MAYLTQQAERDTCTEELAQMFLRELAQGIEDVLLDDFGLGIGLGGIVGDDGRREIGVVDRVVDRDGNFKASVVIDHRSGNTSPHRLGRNEPTDERVIVVSSR